MQHSELLISSRNERQSEFINFLSKGKMEDLTERLSKLNTKRRYNSDSESETSDTRGRVGPSKRMRAVDELTSDLTSTMEGLTVDETNTELDADEGETESTPSEILEVSTDPDVKSDFLDWARGKVTVTWCHGSLCNSDLLDHFEPAKGETLLEFLERIVGWVEKRDPGRGRAVFLFFSEEVGEEYDEYQEELFTPKELIRMWVIARDVEETGRAIHNRELPGRADSDSDGMNTDSEDESMQTDTEGDDDLEKMSTSDNDSSEMSADSETFETRSVKSEDPVPFLQSGWNREFTEYKGKPFYWMVVNAIVEDDLKDAVMFRTSVKIKVPLRADYRRWGQVEISGPVTVSKFVNAVYDYYQQNGRLDKLVYAVHYEGLVHDKANVFHMDLGS